SYNSAGGVALTLKDGDIEYGFTAANGTYTTPAAGFPNTIKVTMRRDSTANKPLSLFFGPLLGKPTVDLQTAAAATIYTAPYTQSAGMLPMTLDVNAWNTYVATGKSS